MIKRIFANVSERVFYAFKGRAAAENLSLEEAFRAIVTAYAEGADLRMLKKPKEHAKSTGAEYGA